MANKFIYQPAAYAVYLGGLKLGDIKIRSFWRPKEIGPAGTITIYGVELHRGRTYYITETHWYFTLDNAARALLREYRYQERGIAKRNAMRARGESVMPETAS